MTTPTDNDDDNDTVDGTSMSDPSEEAAIQQAIESRLAKLSPEEGQKWLERMLALLTQDVIVSTSELEGDGEKE